MADGRLEWEKKGETCPVCGDLLVWSRAGIWCLNRDCHVEDDYLLYKRDKEEKEKK